MATKEQDQGILRLLQIFSASFPIGSFSYSQGLEYAVSANWVNDSQSTAGWIKNIVLGSFARLDLPAFFQSYEFLARQDKQNENVDEKLRALSLELYAYRETSEAREEDKQVGRALENILGKLGVTVNKNRTQEAPCVLFARACFRFSITARSGALALTYAFVEQQVMAAMKLVPLGQTQGQIILLEMADAIAQAVDIGMHSEFGSYCFGAAIASSKHEFQYSRLFRS